MTRNKEKIPPVGGYINFFRGWGGLGGGITGSGWGGSRAGVCRDVRGWKGGWGTSAHKFFQAGGLKIRGGLEVMTTIKRKFIV